MITLLPPKSIPPIPTYQELVTNYGPYLGLVVTLLIAFMIMQYFWFTRTLNAYKAEITRLVEHEKALNDRLFHLVDKRIGFKPPKKP